MPLIDWPAESDDDDDYDYDADPDAPPSKEQLIKMGFAEGEVMSIPLYTGGDSSDDEEEAARLKKFNHDPAKRWREGWRPPPPTEETIRSTFYGDESRQVTGRAVEETSKLMATGLADVEEWARMPLIDYGEVTKVEFEKDYIPRLKYPGHIFLSGYGLYPNWYDDPTLRPAWDSFIEIMPMIDGKLSVVEIAQKVGCNPELVFYWCDRFEEKGLVKKYEYKVKRAEKNLVGF